MKYPIHAAARMNLANIMLSERRQTQKTTCYVIPFVRNVQNRQIHRDRSRFAVVWGWGVGVHGGEE